MNTTDSEILLELFLALDAPEGLRSELIEGEILIELPKPHREEYTEVHLAAFGEPLALPAPFGFDLDTKPFL